MRILWLCKRRYMRQDVIVDRYARLYEIPRELARLGHAVVGACLNYRGRAPAFDALHEAGAGRLEWHSNDLGATVVPGMLAHQRQLRDILDTFAPDIIVGGSDAVHVVLTRRLARAAGLPYAIDLYNNFESFALTRWLGLGRAYRRAIREAELVSCVSAPLNDYVHTVLAARPGATMTVESTINDTLFRSLDRNESRAEFGLPTDRTLIGTAGALDASRGTATLYTAWRRLQSTHPNLGLVLAGPRDPATPIPGGPDVYYLGELAHICMPALFSALDVAVICMRDDAFGRFAFPQKAYEIIACGTPLVAAQVGAIASLLAGQPHCLFDSADSASLARALEHQLGAPERARVSVPTWADQAAALGTRLAGCLEAYNAVRRHHHGAGTQNEYRGKPGA